MPMSAMGSCTMVPATLTAPSVAGRRPATMRSRVDLPQPLGPTRETNSPAPTLSEMPARASTGPLAAWYVMPTRSRPISSVFTPRSVLLRHLDLGEEVGRIDVLALDLLGQAHVGIHQVNRVAHLLLVDPADAVLGVTLGLHQVEPDQHVRRYGLDLDLGHALLEDL